MSEQKDFKGFRKKEVVKFSSPVREQEEIKSSKSLAYFIIFIAVALAIFSTKFIISSQGGDGWVSKIPVIGQISELKNLAESATKSLKGEDRDRINILLLGIGGQGHDGPYLTDTMMVVSLQPSTKKVAMISVPRDLTVPIEGMGWKKINSVDAYAEMKNTGSGGLAASQTVSDVLGIPIDYYVRVDFQGFIKIIDDLGGVSVYVDNTLDDYSYPVLGNEDGPWASRYEHLHIDKGWQEMDGSLALKYARSRHALGIEGSDFARAKRQQKIIEAVKDKLLSMNTILHPTILTNVLGDLSSHISTNLQPWEVVRLWSMFKDVKKEDIINKVLDDSPDGLLVAGRGEDGAYILTPKSGDFSEIQYMANNVFTQAPRDEKSQITAEKASVEIRNGTWVNGLAQRVALDLEQYGFTVTAVANADEKDFQKSVIYDLTYGAKAQSLEILKNKTGANVSFNLPQWLINDIKNGNSTDKPDFILILGQDADQNQSGINNPIQ